MKHDYEVFRPDPSARPGLDVDEAAHDARVREQFARQLATMLATEGQDYAARLVLAERTDGEWP